MKIIKDKVWRLLCAITLCAGVAFFVATCNEDEECKSCTNDQTKETKTFCGDDLKEVQALPNMTCK